MAATERARLRAQGGSTADRSVTEIDEVHQRQIEERQNRSLQELLKGIHTGHESAMRQVREFDEQELGEFLLIRAAGSEMSFAELLLRAGPAHAIWLVIAASSFETVWMIMPDRVPAAQTRYDLR